MQIYIDESGFISRAEFIEIATLFRLDRQRLGLAFDATVASARRRSARTPGGSRVLTFQGFVKLIEELEPTMLVAIRKSLPAIMQPAQQSLLVFDDGKQQLRRLVPGGRALVRRVINFTTTDAVTRDDKAQCTRKIDVV